MKQINYFSVTAIIIAVIAFPFLGSANPLNAPQQSDAKKVFHFIERFPL
jgi:hypothetical protein